MFKTPILLLIFNRPDHLKKIINILKKNNVQNIYVAADGPRKNNTSDDLLCAQSRKLFNNLDWNCRVKKNFLNKNYGCREAVSKGISWFFKNEKYGIILEDDCLPNSDFFNFCKKNLDKYQNEKNIGCITGNNFQKKITIRETYYFSNYPHCWGWATWARAWKSYKKNISFWPKYKKKDAWKNHFKNYTEKKYWTKIFDNTYQKKIDSWAYPWTLCLWKDKMLTITPRSNLVKNVGFRNDATHTISAEDDLKYKTTKLPTKWVIPKNVVVNYTNDEYVFYNHFKGPNYLWPYRFFYILKLAFFSPKIFYLKLKKNLFI